MNIFVKISGDKYILADLLMQMSHLFYSNSPDRMKTLLIHSLYNGGSPVLTNISEILLQLTNTLDQQKLGQC